MAASRREMKPRRPKKTCKTPNCYTGVSGGAKNEYCLACQLDGKAPDLARKEAR